MTSVGTPARAKSSPAIIPAGPPPTTQQVVWMILGFMGNGEKVYLDLQNLSGNPGRLRHELQDFRGLPRQ